MSTGKLEVRIQIATYQADIMSTCYHTRQSLSHTSDQERGYYDITYHNAGLFWSHLQDTTAKSKRALGHASTLPLAHLRTASNTSPGALISSKKDVP